MNLTKQMSMLRRQIDDIDDQLCKLIIKRIELGREIGEVKSNLGLPLKDEQRENEIIRRVIRLTDGYISRKDVTRIFNEIIKATKRTHLLKSKKTDKEN
ncbi:MAG: chorismate mutase [Fidelibacterota bacterium]